MGLILESPSLPSQDSIIEPGNSPSLVSTDCVHTCLSPALPKACVRKGPSTLHTAAERSKSKDVTPTEISSGSSRPSAGSSRSLVRHTDVSFGTWPPAPACLPSDSHHARYRLCVAAHAVPCARPTPSHLAA